MAFVKIATQQDPALAGIDLENGLGTVGAMGGGVAGGIAGSKMAPGFNQGKMIISSIVYVKGDDMKIETPSFDMASFRTLSPKALAFSLDMQSAVGRDKCL